MKYFDNDIFTNHGDPIHILYSPVVNKDGTIELVESGKEDTDEIIQSFAEECDLNVIISKYIAGDETVLNKKIGAYGDFTKMPKTYAEMLQMQMNAKEIFDALPLNIKSDFDNDFNKFFATAGSDEWNDKMKKYYPKEQKEEVEVKTEE